MFIVLREITEIRGARRLWERTIVLEESKYLKAICVYSINTSIRGACRLQITRKLVAWRYVSIGVPTLATWIWRVHFYVFISIRIQFVYFINGHGNMQLANYQENKNTKEMRKTIESKKQLRNEQRSNHSQCKKVIVRSTSTGCWMQAHNYTLLLFVLTISSDE